MKKNNNDKQPVISFVIPVYNAEKFLKRCIKSIQRQTYKNIEIICVNDGSTDESLKVLKKIQSKENRMVIIDQIHGSMDSRKRGAINSSGKYIWFVDDDDEICNKNACKRLIEIFENEKDVQIIQFAIYSVRYSFLKYKRTVGMSGRFSSQSLIHTYYNDYLSSGEKKIITPSVWDKIFDSKLIKEMYQRLIDIPTGAGDLYLNLNVISSKEFHNIFCLDDVFYKYYSGIGSYSKETISFLINYSNIKKFQEDMCDTYSLPEKAKYSCHLESIYYLYMYVVNRFFDGVPDKEIINELNEASKYDCIKRAKAYFVSRPKEELYEELIVLTTASPVEYLDYVKKHAKKPSNFFMRVLKKLFEK